MTETIITHGQRTDSSDGRRVMAVYIVTGLSVAFLLMLVGLTMRITQAGWISLDPEIFYSLLTLHGAGMVVSLLLCGMGGIWYLVRREVDMDIRLAWWAFGLIVAGIAMVIAATVVGKFGAAWTFLYPLPFYNPTWPNWSIGSFLIGIMVITAGWTVWSLQILKAVIRRSGSLRDALGWDMVFHAKEFKAAGREPLPAQMLPAIVISVDGMVMSAGGMVIGVALIVHWINPAIPLDTIWAKNLTYFFGHSIANFIIYMLLAFVYVGLPRYTNRKWNTNAVFVVAWWGTMIFVLTAYFHHMYLDYAQPLILQYFGQVFSYMSAVPVSVVTVYGGLMLIWRAKVRWSVGSIFMYAGMAGWIIGGAGALLDASVPFNVHLHNTLWVPGHFHNYLLGSCLYFALGWVFLQAEERHHQRSSPAMRWLIGVLVFGGTALFLTGFYVSGAEGVPRRYMVQPDPGQGLSALASVGAIVLLGGLLVCLYEGARLWRNQSQDGLAGLVNAGSADGAGSANGSPVSTLEAP